MLFSIFLGAAILSFLGVFLATKTRWPGGPRLEGSALVLAICVAGLVGLAVGYFNMPVETLRASYTTPEQVMARPDFPSGLSSGLQILVLAFMVYLLSALRGIGQLPAWVADLIVAVAAFMAIKSEPQLLFQPILSGRADATALDLGVLTIPVSMLYIWGVARLAAALNRVPQIAGPYLGLVALTLVWATGASYAFGFAPVVGAAIGGAGLALLPFAIKREGFNLGWSATLAVGFLLGCISAIGTFNDSILAIVVLAILGFGLPLLDVSFFQLRATLRGERVELKERRERLHEALLRRGIAPAKVALLYLCMGAWLCLLAGLLTRWFFSGAPGLVLGAVRLVLLIVLAAAGIIVFISFARILMRRAPDEEMPESVEAFGVKLTPVSMVEALDKIEGFIRSGEPHHVVTSDANAILRSREDAEYAAILRRAALIAPDGFGVVWGARLLNLPVYERVTGVDMVTGICERAAQNGWSIYILGSEPGVAATAAQNLAEKYPGLGIAGTQHGFYSKDGRTDEEIVAQIRQARPQVLFVAFGIPKQEKFIAAHMSELNVPVSLGVGGSFDVYSGKFNRAPEKIQRAGLEWLYRVWIDPARWKRMGYVPRFMVVAIRTWLFGEKKEKDVF